MSFISERSLEITRAKFSAASQVNGGAASYDDIQRLEGVTGFYR